MKPTAADADEHTMPAFDPHAWPFFWMTQAVGRYLQRMDTGLKTVDLDVSRWRALMCLDRERPISVSEIADLAIVKLPTMTKLVQRMVLAGLATSAPSREDGRVTEVLLTAKGEAARREAWQIAQRIYNQTFARIGVEDEAELNRILRRVFELLAVAP